MGNSNRNTRFSQINTTLKKAEELASTPPPAQQPAQMKRPQQVFLTPPPMPKPPKPAPATQYFGAEVTQAGTAYMDGAKKRKGMSWAANPGAYNTLG